LASGRRQVENLVSDFFSAQNLVENLVENLVLSWLELMEFGHKSVAEMFVATGGFACCELVRISGDGPSHQLNVPNMD